MTGASPRCLVVGGGFYGAMIAAHRAGRGDSVTLVDAGPSLLSRASYANQARVHHGYHYPRSRRTGLSCIANYPRFLADFPGAVRAGFAHYYAIARRNSLVTAGQFAGVCRAIGAPLRPAPAAVGRLFDRDLVEEVFEVEEAVFDARALRSILGERLAAAGVAVRLGVAVESLAGRADGAIAAACGGGGPIVADRVFLCAYSGINRLLRASGLPPAPMKHEIAEIALVRPPEALRGLGITVMDGPFFSTLPFPAADLHSFSHVRYTPHESWSDDRDDRDPHAYLAALRPESRFPLMLRDAARYMPCLAGARHERSLFEPKTVLIQSERSDARPILHRRDWGLGGLTLVLGGKLDNIYDILDATDAGTTA